MIVLGLTGSIGMGKSTAAEMLRRLGVPVSDADAIVHELIGPGGRAVSAVEDSFPGVTKAGAVDRDALGGQSFWRSRCAKDVRANFASAGRSGADQFLKQSRRYRKRVVALDIPLLYEVEADKLCDATIVVSASSILQETRVLARPGMTREKLENIRKQQMSDLEKRQRATFIVPTGNGRRSATCKRLRGSSNYQETGHYQRLIGGRSCVRLSSIPKPQDWIRNPAIALSKSVALSLITICRQAEPITNTLILSDMPDEAFRVHGLSEAFLAKHPVFADIADAFLEFIGDADLVIHNASFDLGFINAELQRLGRASVENRRAIDTVQIARGKYPGAQASLDALCRRFEIDLSARTKHGALLDAELLADVYLELVGGRQPGFELASQRRRSASQTVGTREKPARPVRPHAPSEAESTAHQAFLEKITDPIWRE